MVKGYEIRLGDAKLGDKGVEMALSYGHNMRRDGTVPSKMVTSLVYTPAGTTLTPSLTLNEDHILIRFSAEGDGYYTAAVDLSPIAVSQTDEGY